MQNLYWKRTQGKTASLVDTAFESEEQFEKYIFDNQELLEDVYIFKRQVKTGNRQGIPDMLGVDQDGKVCLIEMKNEPVTESVLPQVLQYAIWAETNPDSIKALWLEAEHRPEELDINWEALEIRIIVIGPDFRTNVLRMSHKIGYAIELLKVKRFVLDNEEFILMEQLEEPAARKPGITKGWQEYDRHYYEEEHGKDATGKVMRVASDLEAFIKKQGWSMRMKLNKYYVGFKYGNINPFSIHWSGTRAWNVQIKVPEQAARKLQPKGWEMQRYDSGWKQAVFKRTTPKASINELAELLITAYESVRGEA